MLDTTSREYMKEAASWEADRILAHQRSERRAWTVAIIAAVAAVLAIAAICLMMPLKTVALRLIKVDESSGRSVEITEVQDDALSYDEVKDKAWVAKYVTERERYGEDLAYDDYTDVLLLSAPSVAADYKAYMDPDSKASPLNVYGKTGKVYVHINSVSLLGNGVASVRFTRTEFVNGIKQAPSNWIATVAYKYENLKLTEEERRLNPVQIQITEYRRASESIQRGGQ